MNADAAGTATHPRAAKQRAAALCSYRERGVGVLRGLLPATRVQALVEESERLWRRFEPEGAVTRCCSTISRSTAATPTPATRRGVCSW